MSGKIFLQVLNMSFTASIVILFVLAARLLLKKAPKVFSYALWSVVLFRLVCPFSFESVISLLPTKINPIPAGITYAAVPEIDTGIPLVNNAVNAVLPPATAYGSINDMQLWVFLGKSVWLLGIAFLLGYSIFTLIKLQKRLKNAVWEKDNIYIVPNLESPFVMGVFKPEIYLSAGLTDKEKQYILLHEQTHIKRCDHVIKLVCFFVLCIHWFNPLVWAAFFISGRDMEMSCDEAVVKAIGSDVKKDYSSSLLALATGRRIIGGTPLAFGEGDTKGRIKNILNYKKPAFWVAAIAVTAVLAAGIALLANPPQEAVYALKSFAYDENDRLSFTVTDKITDELALDIQIHKTDEYNMSPKMYLFEEERVGGWVPGRSYTAVIPAEQIGSVNVYGVVTRKDNPQKIISEMTVRIDKDGNLDIKYSPEKRRARGRAASMAASMPEPLNSSQGGIKPESTQQSFTVKDFAGNDITAEAIRLWKAANRVYNVDDTDIFEMDNAPLIFENSGEFDELKNYDTVVDGIFNAAGRRQLESTKIGGDNLLIQMRDGKIYRKSSWKTGHSYENAVDMQVAGVSGSRVILRVQYKVDLWNPALPAETGFASFTIAKEGGRWLAEDYAYPEAYLEPRPFFIPDMNEEQQKFNDEYVKPILLSALLMRDWNVGDYSGILPNSVGNEGSYLMYAFEDIMGNSNMQPLRIKYQGKYPEKIVEDVLLAHFGFTVEQLHELLSFYYRPQEKIYEYEGGRGGGPIDCAVTGVTKHADGSVTLDYVYMTTYYHDASNPEKDAYLEKTNGRLTLTPTGDGGYLYTAVDVDEII